MAFSLLGHGAAGSANTNTAAVTIDSTGASLIIVGVSDLDGTPAATVADNKGNGAYTALTAHSLSASVRSRLFYFLNPTGTGTGHTITVTGTAGFPSIAVASFVGDAGSSSYDSSENGSTAAADTTILPGVVTPAGSNSIIVEHVGWVGAIANMTINLSFIETDELDYSAGTYFGVDMAYLVTSSSANPTWTTNAGVQRDLACSGAAFTVGAVAAGTSATTGTVTTATEADIVTGGKTVILTLTGDTWVASGGTFDAQRQNIIDGMTAAASPATGWNNVVKALQGVSGVVRTSATVVTVTLDAQATYDISSNETVTVTIPSTALTGAVAIVSSPTFTITAAGATTWGPSLSSGWCRIVQ